jgi:hypothetical protein
MHGKATMHMKSNFGLLLCPKSIKNGQIWQVLASIILINCNSILRNNDIFFKFFEIF